MRRKQTQLLYGVLRFIFPLIGIQVLCCGPNNEKAPKQVSAPPEPFSTAQPGTPKLTSPIIAPMEANSDSNSEADSDVKPEASTEPSTVAASSPAATQHEDAMPTGVPENPCEQERPVRLTLVENVPQDTPYGIRAVYRGGGHKILAGPEGGRAGDLPFYEFTFRKEKRRAEYRKTADDWRDAENFLGICWRGAGKAKWHPKSVTIELAPMCTEADELVKKRCNGAFRKKTE